jgi:hypothetical protein
MTVTPGVPDENTIGGLTGVTIDDVVNTTTPTHGVGLLMSNASGGTINVRARIRVLAVPGRSEAP